MWMFQVVKTAMGRNIFWMPEKNNDIFDIIVVCYWKWLDILIIPIALNHHSLQFNGVELISKWIKVTTISFSSEKNYNLFPVSLRYYLFLMPIACFILPTLIPVYFWGETLKNAWFVATMFRWTFVLNVTWLVNSAAHLYGDHPYDKCVDWLYLSI